MYECNDIKTLIFNPIFFLLIITASHRQYPAKLTRILITPCEHHDFELNMRKRKQFQKCLDLLPIVLKNSSAAEE